VLLDSEVRASYIYGGTSAVDGVRAAYVYGEVSAVSIAWALQLELYAMRGPNWKGLFAQMQALEQSMQALAHSTQAGWLLFDAVPTLTAAIERAILTAAAVALKTGPDSPRSTVAVRMPCEGSKNFTVIIGADEFWERSAPHRIDPEAAVALCRPSRRAMSAPPAPRLQEIYAVMGALAAKVGHPHVRLSTRPMQVRSAAVRAMAPLTTLKLAVPPLGPRIQFKVMGPKGIKSITWALPAEDP